MIGVKGSVKATGRGTRRERARQTRGRMLDAARVLFVGQSYAATTMEQIAAEAGVAVQTVYYSFGTKARLLCEVVEVAGAGQQQPTPVMERAWMGEALSTSSAQRALALVVEHGVDIYERVGPLRAALAAASAADPYVEEYARRIASGRRAGMGRLVARLADIGSLRIDPGRATDLLFVLESHETFLGLTHDAGWSVAEYKSWLFDILRQQLLGAVPPEDSATAGLSFDKTTTPTSAKL